MPTTLVFLPGEYHGQRNLADCSPQDGKELAPNEATQHSTAQHSTAQWAPSCLRLLGEAPVVSLYPLCAQGACAGVGKVSVVIFVAICELSWGCLGWDLEISLHPFWLGHPSLLMPNFLPNNSINKTSLCTEKPKKYMTHFTEILALLWQSGNEPTILRGMLVVFQLITLVFLSMHT